MNTILVTTHPAWAGMRAWRQTQRVQPFGPRTYPSGWGCSSMYNPPKSQVCTGLPASPAGTRRDTNVHHSLMCQACFGWGVLAEVIVPLSQKIKFKTKIHWHSRLAIDQEIKMTHFLSTVWRVFPGLLSTAADILRRKDNLRLYKGKFLVLRTLNVSFARAERIIGKLSCFWRKIPKLRDGEKQGSSLSPNMPFWENKWIFFFFTYRDHFRGLNGREPSRVGGYSLAQWELSKSSCSPRTAVTEPPQWMQRCRTGDTRDN